MEMNQLRYVVAVARAGNFSRAAEQCHVSQPSLSQQIQKLEDELGERLFDRMKRQTKLTPHGEAFVRRAVRILEEAELAVREASDAKSLMSGTLTIGVLPTIAPYLLPKTIGVFVRKYPGVEIVVQEDTTAQLLKHLTTYEIDFAFVSDPIDDSRFEVKELFSEELLLALPPGHPLARKRTVPAAALKGERLIVMREGLLRAPRHEADSQLPQRPTRDDPCARGRGLGPFVDPRDGGPDQAPECARVSFHPVTAPRAEDPRRLAKAASARSRGECVSGIDGGAVRQVKRGFPR
jgi:DNA-binding transcriptional LysR family regulator